MSTNPEAEADDLDITAELPQLDIESFLHTVDMDEQGGRAASDAGEGEGRDDEQNNAQHPPVGVPGRQSKAAELARQSFLSLRARVPALEMQLESLQRSHAALDQRYETLHAAHGDLLTHSYEMTVDRERLAEERLVLINTNRQVREELDHYRSAHETELAAARAQLAEDAQLIASLRDQLQREREQHRESLTHQQQAAQELAGLLREEQDCSQLLRAELYQLKVAHGRQEATTAQIHSAAIMVTSEAHCDQTGNAQQEAPQIDANNTPMQPPHPLTIELEMSTVALRELQQQQGRLTADLAEIRPQHTESEHNYQQRDQFILEQAREIEQLQGALQTAAETGYALRQSNDVQARRISDLEQHLAHVQEDFARQAAVLQRLRDTINEKHVAKAHLVKRIAELEQRFSEGGGKRTPGSSPATEMEVPVRTLVRADDSGVVHLLNQPVMYIGRLVESEIQIMSDAISRRHARLRISPKAVIVEDLDSTNGIAVNGRRVKRHLLRDGDQLEIGKVQFRFSARSTAAEPPTTT